MKPKNQPLSPLANVRWWVSFIPVAVIILFASLFTAGKIIGYFSEWAFCAIHKHAFRPLVRWTWGDKP